MLAVDRKQPPAAARLRCEGELARGDEALLVREREVDAALERPERHRQAGEADDGVEDDVWLGALEQLGEVASDLGQRGESVDRCRAGGRGDELELGVGADDLERLPADRPGRSDQGDALLCHADSMTVGVGVTPLSPSRWRPARISAVRSPRGGGRVLDLVEGEDDVERRDRGEERRVDAVEHAAVAAEQVAGVLHAHVPLEQ